MTFNLRSKRTLVAFGAVLALAAPLAAHAGGPVSATPGARVQQDTDRIIVKYRDGARALSADSAVQGAARRNLGLKLLRHTALGAQVLRLNSRISLAEAEALAQEIQASDPNVEYAEVDRRMYALFTPNDTEYASRQWHYFEATAGINAPAAWDKRTGAGVVVAVIDTGSRPHIDLAANLIDGYDFISDAAESHDGDGRDGNAEDNGDYSLAGECDSNAYDSSWHGTHVAGTIAAVTNNAQGVAGVAFNAKVQPVRVLGRCGGSFSDIQDAIVWASGGSVSGVPANPTPAKVINMSLGGSGSCPSTLQDAINSARSRGTVVVVAAGNSNVSITSSNATPANCSGVVTVAAVGRNGGRASYSNYGALVDLAAPGGSGSDGVRSTLNSGTQGPVSSANGGDIYASYQGTSMATPHVAAVAAMMLEANPALTPDDVEARLKFSTRAFPATCGACGHGLLDANAAIDAATAAAPTAVTETTASNNTIATAQAITALPSVATGSLSSSDTQDFYSVSLAAGKTLTALLTMPSSADFELAIQNSSGTVLASSLANAGIVDRAAYTNSGTAAVTLYVRVYRSSGSGTYGLTVRL